jgi:hypothetical protein
MDASGVTSRRMTGSTGKFNWGCLISVVLVGIIPGIVLQCAGLLPNNDERHALDKLEPKIEKYLAASGTPTGGKPALDGRIVTIDVEEEEIDEDVFIALPDRLQARSPKQVSTVVLINYGREVVGEYQNGEDAIQEFARLTIVDLQTGEQFTGKRIYGPTPPYVKRENQDSSGGKPGAGEIADYLKHLPRVAA